jgi:hypothetical protein
VRIRNSGPLLAVVSAFLSSSSLCAQTWTPLSRQPPVPTSFCLLLTDGSVICQSAQFGARPFGDWYKLKPDLAGSYVNGTWSQIASMPPGYAPQAFAAAVLPDGRVVIEGGEYDSTGALVVSNLGAV